MQSRAGGTVASIKRSAGSINDAGRPRRPATPVSPARINGRFASRQCRPRTICARCSTGTAYRTGQSVMLLVVMNSAMRRSDSPRCTGARSLHRRQRAWDSGVGAARRLAWKPPACSCWVMALITPDHRFGGCTPLGRNPHHGCNVSTDRRALKSGLRRTARYVVLHTVRCTAFDRAGCRDRCCAASCRLPTDARLQTDPHPLHPPLAATLRLPRHPLPVQTRRICNGRRRA